jgi:oxygen-independent coproporphyrinogen-3 oxidase
MERPYRHVYAHFPFCDVICHYCDFYTARSQEARQEEFFSALLREVELALPFLPEKLTALYLGGGTPGLSPPPLLHKFLAAFGSRLGPETEITIEANPTLLDRETARAWAEMGINRVSLGLQSLDDGILKRLGRVHDGKTGLHALETVREFIPNVSGDLIYGVPGQQEGELAREGEAIAAAGATHLSAYHLTLAPSHFLHAKLPADTFAWNQIRLLSEALAGLGFAHYEVSNFCLPGKFSRNNCNYWQGGAYWALGPSAHGFDGKFQRWKNVADWEKYVTLLARGESPVESRETLTLEQRRIETLFTALRTSQGLCLEEFLAHFQVDLLERHASFMRKLQQDGLGTLDNGYFALTFAGRMLADEIVHRLL